MTKSEVCSQYTAARQPAWGAYEFLTSTPPRTQSRKAPPGSVALSPRQIEVLDAVRSYVKTTGVPPARSDLKDALAVSGQATVDSHLAKIAARGWIRLWPGVERGIALLREGAPLYEPDLLARAVAGPRRRGEPPPEPRWINAPDLWDVFGAKPDLLLRVRGDAMNRAGLADGAVVALRLVRRAEGDAAVAAGDIVAARFGDEVVPRRVGAIDAQTIELRPESRSRKHRSLRLDMHCADAHIIGVVIGRVAASTG